MTKEQEEYYQRQAISSSILKEAFGSDTQVLNAISQAYRSQDTSHFRMGKLVHVLSMMPEELDKDFVIVDASTRTTNIYKDTAKGHPEKTVMLKKEYEEARTIANNIRATKSFQEIQDGLIAIETPLYWEWKIKSSGANQTVPCKALPDMVSRNKEGNIVIADIKTTSEADPTTFIRHARWKFKYNLQAAWYIKSYIETAKEEIDNDIIFQFLVAYKSEPYFTYAIKYRKQSMEGQEDMMEIERRAERVAKLWHMRKEQETIHLGDFIWEEEEEETRTTKAIDIENIITPFD